MTFFTIAKLKTWIASIPAGANNWEIGFSDAGAPTVVQTGIIGSISN